MTGDFNLDGMPQDDPTAAVVYPMMSSILKEAQVSVSVCIAFMCALYRLFVVR